MRNYQKLIAQLVATVLAGIVPALAGDNHISAAEWINVVILALGAVAVLGAGNLPEGVWAHTKAIVSAATAGAVLLQSSISGGVNPTEWLQIALAVLGALGVLAVKGPVVLAVRRTGLDGPAV